MHITITDAEYQELMRIKREHEALKVLIKKYFMQRCINLKTNDLPNKILELIK